MFGRGRNPSRLALPGYLAWSWVHCRRAAARALVALGAAVVVFVGHGSAPRPHYRSRGPARGVDLAASQLQVYRLAPGQPPGRAEGTISARDELAFAYRNGADRRYLMVFGVDEARRVFWYHPGWAIGASPPSAVPAAPGIGPHELSEAVQHNLRGRALRVFGLFIDEPLSVTAVEASVAASADGVPRVPGGTMVELSLEVTQ